MIKYIYFQNFVSKSWEISVLMLLPILALQGKISLAEVGMYSAIFAAMQMIGTVLSSFLAQKFGRYYTMLGSILLYAIAWFLISFGENVAFFSIAYFVAGLGAGLIEATGTVVAAKLFPKGNRVGAMALHGVAGDLGRIIATSLVALVVSLFGLISFSRGVFAFSIVVFIFQSLVLRQISVLFEKVDNVQVKAHFFDLGLFSHKKYSYALLVQFLDAFGSASLYLFLPILLQSKGFPELLSGQLTVLLMVGYLSGRVVLSWISKRYGLLKALIFGEYLMILCIIALLVFNNAVIIAIVLFFAGAATRGTSPIAKAMIIDAIPENRSIDIAVGQAQTMSRALTSASRPFYASIGQYFGMPMAFVASGMVIFLVTFPALRYNSEK